MWCRKGKAELKDGGGEKQMRGEQQVMKRNTADRRLQII